MNTDYSIFRGKKIIYRKNISTNVYTYVFKIAKNLGDKFEDKSKNWRLSEHKISLGKGGDKSIILNSNGNFTK
ncbi:MAG: hypothetical protein IPJ01_11785 [Micavibrio sp.]|nr:hypothetical protein [Micavibrio sp.]